MIQIKAAVVEIQARAPKKEITLIKACTLDTIQDFLDKLGMKPCLYLVEISIFSLNHVIVQGMR